MAIKTIRLLGDPILRTRCTRVGISRVRSVRTLIRDLRDTLRGFRRRRGFGRGIAAPQIGSLRRVIYIDHGFTGALIDPVIVQRSRATFALWDDCFSFPDLLVRLRRHRRINVRYIDDRGETATLDASGSLSELLQHEIDHLDGVLALDRAARTRDIILRSERRKVRP